MKLEDIKIGKRYHICYEVGKNHWSDYVGGAVCVAFNPPNYDEGTIEFKCDDGENGYFDAKYVEYELTEEGQQKVTITLDQLGRAVQVMNESKSYYNQDSALMFDTLARELGFKNV